jgi:hypothetical protein
MKVRKVWAENSFEEQEKEAQRLAVLEPKHNFKQRGEPLREDFNSSKILSDNLVETMFKEEFQHSIEA